MILVSLPLAILVAVTGLFFAGATLNTMTLGGLALVISILIDQSIVVVAQWSTIFNNFHTNHEKYCENTMVYPVDRFDSCGRFFG